MTSGIQGKVVVITGASSGLGEAAVRRLAKDGIRVEVLADRRDHADGDAVFGRILDKDGVPLKNADNSDVVSPSNDFSNAIRS